MATADSRYSRSSNPVDLVEQVASAHDWPIERTNEDELTMTIAGNWADYHVSLNWRTDLESLHIACAFDFKVPDIWAAEGLIMYRHGLMLNGAVVNVHQCEALLRTALEACERYYQAFQFVVWAGKDSRHALASAMFETEGRA
jgi:hypothetical protein